MYETQRICPDQPCRGHPFADDQHLPSSDTACAFRAARAARRIQGTVPQDADEGLPCELQSMATRMERTVSPFAGTIPVKSGTSQPEPLSRIIRTRGPFETSTSMTPLSPMMRLEQFSATSCPVKISPLTPLA